MLGNVKSVSLFLPPPLKIASRKRKQQSPGSVGVPVVCTLDHYNKENCSFYAERNLHNVFADSVWPKKQKERHGGDTAKF